MFARPAQNVAAGLLAAALLLSPNFARAQSAPSTIAGTVVDATDGVPVESATVRLDGGVARTTDNAGRFEFPALAPGDHRVAVTHEGYQPVISDVLRLRGGERLITTVPLQRATQELHVIAVTAAHPTDTLAKTSTFSRTLNTEELLRRGVTRAGDALRELPAVNNGITGDTAALSDDINLSVRGIGTLETVAAIDGHPIGYGIKGGYNYQLSPVFPFRNAQVLYGSGGSDLLGVNAIGGVVNFQTIDPTPGQEVSVTQGYGTFDKLATNATMTGTSGRLGYALAYGVSGLDGPLRNDYLYQSNAAYDQSATDPAVRSLGVYRDDSSAVSRAGLAKLRYRFNDANALTFASTIASYWNDKTGNGDGDYLDYAPALAFAQQLLASKKPSDPCGAGMFTATNANGAPNGTAPGGTPDGGTRCQTPQQYAQFNAGWQGAGPSWQALQLNDEDLSYRHEGLRSAQDFQLFSSRYGTNADRRFNLPFHDALGDNGNSKSSQVTSTGAIATTTFVSSGNDLTLGASYLDNAYLIRAVNRAFKVTQGSPTDYETAYFVSDAFHSERSPLTAYLNLWVKHASATNSSYVDPRLAFVYRASPRDVVRASFGATTTQPSSDMLEEPFIEAPPGGAGGGTPIACSSLNSIGSAPSSLLQPERGVDLEAGFAHRWFADSETQLSVYDVNVFNKLYSTIVPLSQTGTAFIDPAYLASVSAQIDAKCGAGSSAALLGVSGNFNVGTLRATGADLSGRMRVTRRLFVDYDWALSSTVLLNANASLLQANETLVPGDQLPRLPLHTFTGAIDQTFSGGLNVRYTLHAVSVNNTKALPAYDYSDLRLSYPLKDATVSVTVSNLFNQWADIRGLRYEGVPLPLNSYATAASYAPYTGANATERFGLPYPQHLLQLPAPAIAPGRMR